MTDLINSRFPKIERKCSAYPCNQIVEVYAKMLDNDSYVKLFGRCKKCAWKAKLTAEEKANYKRKLFAPSKIVIEE